MVKFRDETPYTILLNFIIDATRRCTICPQNAYNNNINFEKWYHFG